LVAYLFFSVTIVTMDEITRHLFLAVHDGNNETLEPLYQISKMPYRRAILSHLIKSHVTGRVFVSMFKNEWNRSITTMYSKIMQRLTGRPPGPMTVGVDYVV
jgi:hypothetical protein